MSNTIDSKVVELRFDNQQFEKNVSTTLSTLDKLKEKLHFGGASKGLENISAAAKKVDMNGLSGAVETVSAKFSAMQVIGVTALANITNSAVNAGKRIVSALTIDPITTGFEEYETQINAVQTILANTSNKGSTIEDVNDALDELNKYADLTIYNFTEMTRNIGTFTAAGVDLDTSVSAIQGIANLAAVSGSTSQQASTAMYQLSQALASGTVKLMDWNSVVNAGMGGEVFQNALKRTATVMGTNVDALIEKYGSFRETLSSGWLTTDVLTETLNQFTLAAEEGTKEWEEYKTSLKEKGYTEEQAVEILKMANTATEAATKVKTFTQLWDVLKESAQSGWTQTWNMIIGDYEEAKNLLSPLADFLTGIINGFSEARNKVLEGALGKSFKGLVNTVKECIDPVRKSADSIKEVVDSVKDYASVVDEIIGGKWGNGQERWDKLTESGYDWAHAQNLVNEKLGCSLRRATDYKEAQDGVTKSQEELSESTIDYIVELTKLSDAQLKEMGYADSQIKMFRTLAEAADKTGIPLKEFIENIDEIDGRYLLINSFKNAGQGLISVCKAIGQAWKEAFHGDASDEEIMSKRSKSLYNIIAAIHKFSTKLVASEETVNKITRTFKGLFAILDIITTIVGGSFKIAFKIVSKILSYFHLDILDVTAAIGDALVGFRDWLESMLDISKVLDIIVPAVETGVKAVKKWVKAFAEIPMVSKFINQIKDAFSDLKSLDYASIVKGWVKSFADIPIVSKFISKIKDAFSDLKNFDYVSVGKDLIAGFSNGIGEGVKHAFTVILEFGKTLLEKFCDIIGVQSPSWKMFEIAQDFIQGFLNGLGSIVGTVWEYIKAFGAKCIEVIGGINWGAVFAVGVSLGMLYSVKKIADALETFAAPLEGLSDILSETSKVVQSFGKVTKAIALDIKTKAIKNLAISLAILVGAIVVLSFIDIKEIWNAVAVIVVLAGVLVALAWASSKMSDASVDIGRNGASIEGLKSGLISIGIAILLLATTVKLIGSMDTGQAIQGFLGLAGIMTAMIVFLYACQKVTRGNVSENISKIGSLMIKIAFALMLMVGVIKLIDSLDAGQMLKGAAFAAGFAIFVAILAKAANGSDKYTAKLGSMLIKVAIAMALMVGVVKLVDSLNAEQMIKGAAFAAAFVIFVKALVKSTQIGSDKQIAKLGGLLMSVSISMLLMAGLCKIVGSLTPTEMFKGAVFAAAFVILVKALVSVTTVGNDQQIAKVGATILAMALALGIMAGVTALLSLISIGGLIKGITAIGLLSMMLTSMIKATQGANDVKGNLIVMTVAIGLMAAAVAGLSLIDPSRLAGATLAMSMLMATFGLMAKMAGTAQSSMGTIIVMTVAMAAMAGILWLLSTLNIQSSLANAAALSVLLISVSAAMFILSKMSTSAVQALVGIALLTAMAVPMLAFVGVLAVMNYVQNATANAVLLTGLMVTMTVLLAALTVVGGFALLAAVGIIALTAMAIPMLTFVGILALMNYVQNATNNASLLIGLMTTMTKILVALARVGPLALIGVAAMQGLVLLIGEVAILATALGALVEHFPQLQTFLDVGLPLMERLAGSIGTMIGNFVSGMLTSISAGLPQIGMDLSMFMVNVTSFIAGAKLVDETVLTGVKNLAAAIALLSGAELLAGIASFMNGGSSFAQLGMYLSTFMVNAAPFITGIKLIDPAVAEGAKALAETILILTGANLIDGITSWLTGGSSLGDFGVQLAELGGSLNTFVTSLGSFDESKQTTVSCAAKAIKTMAEAANEIPNEGGWAAKIFGDNSIAAFGDKLPGLGTNLSSFATNLGTFDDATLATVKCASNAIKAMAEAAKDIPNEGGWAAKILGDNSLATFGSKLPELGTNLSSFATNLGTFDDDTVSTVNCASKAIKAMADAASNIDGQAGWAKKLFGDNSLATFGTQLGSLGTNLASFASNLGTFTDSQVTTVNAAVRAIKALAGLADANLKGAKNNLSGFSDKLGDFGSDISSMCEGLPSSTTVDSATKVIKAVLSLIKDVAKADASGAASFTKSLKDLGTDGVTKFVNAFKSNTSVTSIKKAGFSMAENIIKGLNSKKTTFEKACRTFASSGISAIRDKYENFYNAGSYLVTGFASGISENTFKAEAKAKAMANAAEKAAKEALDINSPSKVFRRIGTSVPEGFAMGISKLGSKVKAASVGMTDTALDGVKGAISRIAEAVNTDIDSQPVIRPVLDMSDIQAGAGTINGLFGMTPSVGVMSNVRAISSMMNRNQNGGNGDVVSAIDKLRKDLGNIGGNSYNINGITYDDGSNVSEAIKTLVRATRVERRI